MIGAICRHRVAFVVAVILILLAAVWLAIYRQNADKIPMRGVFVYGLCTNKQL